MSTAAVAQVYPAAVAPTSVAPSPQVSAVINTSPSNPPRTSAVINLTSPSPSTTTPSVAENPVPPIAERLAPLEKGPDTAMLTPEVLAEIARLEMEASVLLTRAAQLRAGTATLRPTASTRATSSARVPYDPDGPDGWEFAALL